MIEENRQACAIPKISVTPKMVKAALAVLNKSGILEYPTDSDYPVVKKMLKAAILQYQVTH